MAETITLEPDLGFIKDVSKLGGGDLKKCYQCATCSVACKISPDNKPFPRKEMIAASWGLKDRLVADYDVWLCHNCGDCTTLCPRGAKPGDVMGAIRAYAVKAYSKPAFLTDWPYRRFCSSSSGSSSMPFSVPLSRRPFSISAPKTP